MTSSRQYPEEPDTGSCEMLSALAQGSRIIGIGEGAHFVAEFSQARISLVRHFVEHHGFSAVGLECGAIQSSHFSEWLHTASGADELERIANPLTFALYGSVLRGLKSYLQESGRTLDVIGIDLPNTLNPRDDLEHFSNAMKTLDPLIEPEVDALIQSLNAVCGQSAEVSSAQWGELGPIAQDRAIAAVMRLKLRLASLKPILIRRGGDDVFQQASDAMCSVEHTLATLRIMKTFFEGGSLEGDTSVRESFMAGVVEEKLRADPELKMLLLAHNNHIQKTPVRYSEGKLTAVPMGQHLAHRDDYRAIGMTHLGATVPKLKYPSPEGPLGFSVVAAPADTIRPDSVEQRIIDTSGIKGLFVALAKDVIGTKRMRSQGASIETNVNEAFDAICSVPSVHKDHLIVDVE